ncbi:VCBS repeat-containing protein [Tamlana sp. 2201CG12-4]|uniref:VCBS repeat-containing protein n=1 Tax=Tamlana sp. 2201CG12-4 TaxID=3112582 RepID=UPI002DB5C61D|nr:VCBS repeat-containing protein [Tamlana sp. 2201CG12-4]MEC3907876.1 VCBS repeat-containing protein [Tamlana sp. 2201CG12-4]
MISKELILVCIFFIAISFGCKNFNKELNQPQKFSQVPTSISKVEFTNQITETDSLNYFNYGYMYMGGGVSLGDINNDGLTDIFFTGNMVDNKLYLNKGNFQFEDITNKAGIQGSGKWYTGSTMVDINNDGLLDIYVNVSGKKNYDKANELYVNQGNLEFKEQASEYGIADAGHSTQSTFFDYDKDGDLDLYVANYPITPFDAPNMYYQMQVKFKDMEKSDNLYRNEGNGFFSKVTKEAGILNFGLSLSATVSDLNNDSWPDIYVSNDFAAPDYLYINNQDGTFKETLKTSTRHTAFYGMGVDIADFNNDGATDILQVDMTPEDNRRSKANMASMNPQKFWEIVNGGMHYQYMQNVLQLNQGVDQNGIPIMGDVSRIAGVATTDWSWAALWMDIDNDGWKDIYITNGSRRDINNKDFFIKLKQKNQFATSVDKFKVNNFNLLPSEKIPNYAFINNGDLTFTNKSEALGLDFKGFSNGVSYADLDNDGDLDLVVNNLDDVAHIYENNTKNTKNHYLRLKFNGSESNRFGLGASVTLKTKRGIQYQELQLTRGFQSSVEPVLHFGLGKQEKIEEINITWSDGKKHVLDNIYADQELVVDYYNSKLPTKVANQPSVKLFENSTDQIPLLHEHHENQYNDYLFEVLLPHKYSTMGAGMAISDINNDGLDDVFFGNANGASGSLLVQEKNNELTKIQGPWEFDADYEDTGVLFFDANGDGLQDLYVVSGGNERLNGDEFLADRLYINKGNQKFVKETAALPNIYMSGSVVKAMDYDRDGDLDLFIGGRSVPKAYPKPASSYILENISSENNVKFRDVTHKIAPDLKEIGLVTDAIWTDYNNDGLTDLILVGEWMPITLMENQGKTFTKKSSPEMKKTIGWWYTINQGDFDGDGDMDYVAGNLGLNYKYKATKEEPFEVFASDFDNNGKLDIVLGYYQNGIQFPVRGRQCSSEQVPDIKKKFKDYESFSTASLVDIYSENLLSNALHYKAITFASSYIENLGHGEFKISPLPNEAQISSVNTITVQDYDGDGNLDMVIAGNLYNAEVETTRNDASIGLWLKGNGKGGFSAVDYQKSGLRINGEVKQLGQLLLGHNRKYLIASMNNAKPELIKINN